MNLHDLTGFLIHRTDIKLTNYFIKKLNPYGVTPEQWGVICILDSQRGMIQKELADFIDKDQTTLVRIIHSMMKKKIVQKQINVEDRRSHYLFLTEKGEDLKKTHYPLLHWMLSSDTKSHMYLRIIIDICIKSSFYEVVLRHAISLFPVPACWSEAWFGESFLDPFQLAELSVQKQVPLLFSSSRFIIALS